MTSSGAGTNHGPFVDDWKRRKRFQRSTLAWACASFLGLFTCLAGGISLQPTSGWNTALLWTALPFGILLAVSGLVAVAGAAMRPCPRCKQPFKSTSSSRTIGRSCYAHCGLPRGAPSST